MENLLVTVVGSLVVMAIIALIWLYYSFKNHMQNYEVYKKEQDEYINDKLKIERLTTEKQALELKADYTEKFNMLKNEHVVISSTMENYIKRSVEVDEKQTESIDKLYDLIINRLLNGATKEKTGL
jgi:hypothetical protein